jgi:hypothetical protein
MTRNFGFLTSLTEKSKKNFGILACRNFVSKIVHLAYVKYSHKRCKRN